MPRAYASEALLFLGCGIGKPHVHAAAKAAQTNATSIEKELLAEGLIEPDLYYRWLAEQLGLAYLERIEPSEVVRLDSTDVLLTRDGPLRVSRAKGQITVIVPEARYLDMHRAQLAQRPRLRDRLAVASPATIRTAVWRAGAADRVRKITFELDQDHLDASARRVMTGPQGFVLGTATYGFATAFLLWPAGAFAAMHLCLTAFFSGVVLLRLSALVASLVNTPKPLPERPAVDTGLPVYTLLIALRNEAEMVPAIVSRISALRWPKSRLDIKYICEISDTATISALQSQNLGPESEIVRIPDFGPRTKPKALQYALQGARGSLIAVYDAEDKPAPGQLLEAWTVFRNSDPSLGCLQSPLAIANLRSNWITGLFALEYSGLFRVLIPFLARLRMPIPLGGTSNHFLRSALEKAGGWDPHNVTEDADLGLRLYAHGYHTGTLSRATVEVAPSSLNTWIRQRTRWLKGWAQTWLVAMRRPLHTGRALGAGGFVIFQLMIAGMLVSALAHPLMFAFIGFTIAWLASDPGAEISTLQRTLMWIDLGNIGGSYLTFFAMGWRGFTLHERARLSSRWLCMTPVYWLLMSYAGWRALGQLASNAHLWEKTPHHAPPEWVAAAKGSGIAGGSEVVERVKGIEPSS
ncbi:glycosyltransferase family 2 protein [Hoeflea sp. YIM 152468]|uniref:glycosyltransferase family 2 protein n=1 Tax=Hoeflea sp. YIM 152468 TaxID=3031759 RepID=UPI0023DAE1CC|nr:glycosyltransferase family 2 protein [Hoeflea sp. YIM 152468]MDF1608772.1 glycosyltransferase family 2 protein [Hoeflea sp. YIM 152468]